MTEMIRAVARAICKSRSCQGISCCGWPAQGGRLDCPAEKGGYDDAARAAIETMRAPTVEMMDGAKPYMDSWSSNVAWWIAMHDMALHGTQHAAQIIKGIDEVNAAIRAAAESLNIHKQHGSEK